jgi:hypothetical protein
VSSGHVIGVMAHEHGEVVRVDLFGERMRLRELVEARKRRHWTHGADEDIVEETVLVRRDVCKPAAEMSAKSMRKEYGGEECKPAHFEKMVD